MMMTKHEAYLKAPK